MVNPVLMRTVLAMFSPFIGFTCLGCSESSPAAPSAPIEPSRPPTPAPTIARIAPGVGSTTGDTRVKISGAGFQSPAMVIIGHILVEGRFDHRDPPGTVIYAETPAHAPGTVDVVVMNPDRQTGMLSGGYTYTAPHSFEFNGSWFGHTNNGEDMPILFTIENSLLRRLSCDTSVTLEFSPPVPVHDGEFVFEAEGGVSVSGRLASTSVAVGTINLAPCTSTTWFALRP